MIISSINQNFGANIPKTKALSNITFAINYHESKDYAKRFITALNEMMPDESDKIIFTKCEYIKDKKSFKWGATIIHQGKVKVFTCKHLLNMNDDGYTKACHVADYVADMLSKISDKKQFFYPSLG